MKTNHIIALVSIAAVTATSCSTISNTATTQKIDSQIVNLTVAEMKVNKEKASKSVEWNWTPFGGQNITAAKQNATARLLSEAGADVLVEPQYETESRGLFRGGKVTVTGYPAVYTGFHPMTEAEAGTIATLKFPPTSSTTVQTPGIINAIKQKIKVPKAKAFRPKKEWNNTSFLALNYAAEIADETTNAIGLKYGHYCRNRWGWYVGLDLNIGKTVQEGTWETKDGESIYVKKHCHWNYENQEYEICSRGHRSYSASATVGAMFAISNVVGIYAGTGIGSILSGNYDYNKWGSNHEIGNGYYKELSSDPDPNRVMVEMPLELGLDFRFGPVNFMIGYQHKFAFDDIRVGYYDYHYERVNADCIRLGLGVNF